MDFFSLFRQLKNARKSKKPAKPLAQQHQARPGFEPLEDRMLMSANVISGFVYHDANNNGIFDAGETPIANAKLELRNTQNQVVAATTSDATGHYQFTRDDTVSTTPMTIQQQVIIPDTSAGFDITKQVNQFDPTKGQLLEVDIIQNGAITSDIRAENNSTLTGATITGTVSGKITLNGAGVSIDSAVSNNAGTFNASAFDGAIDFAGTSGKDFGPITATSETKTLTLTGNQMNAFIGNGQLDFHEIVQANSMATGGGNMTANITSTANASFTVIYKYKPGNPLLPGNYTIVETEQPFIPGTQTRYFDGKDAQVGVPIPNSIGTDSIPVVLNGQDVPNNNFGELAPVTVHGNVYFDANNNGTFDAGETGIGGTVINLTGTDYMGQTVTLTTTTAADGSYGFINLRPGTYTLNEIQPTGWLDGKDSLGSLGGTISNDQFSNIVTPAGANGADYNFGELKNAGLAGFVYNDVNNNGIKDAGENGIAGVTVTLTGANDQGPVTLSTQTAADGSYKFDNLRAGTYTITESQPAAWLDGKDTVGTPGGIASNDQFSNNVLGNGVQGVNNNFGELMPGSVAGTVYQDVNNNGQLDQGENGIAGTPLTLTGIDDNGQVVALATTTAADGSYKFANLRPGTYALNESQPAGWLDGKDSLGTQGGVLTNDHVGNIALAQGINGVNNNFGELQSGDLAGFVYSDSNNNGIKNTGEHGIGNTAITLTGTDDLGAISLNTTTAADGSYSFKNLRPGIYNIHETQPTAYQDGKDLLGSLGGVMTNDNFAAVPLQQGQHGTDYDFGEIAPTGLSGFVWHDTNNNGLMDGGETGIGGVTIKLTGTTTTNQPVSQQTTTAADGSYSFDGLQAGTYSIQETQPAGWLDGKDSLGSAGGVMTNDNFANISVPEGTLGTNYNFGELKPGSLAGHVWQDDNNNGQIDAGEQGIGGATVKLTGTNAFGASVSQQTTTANDGTYNFANLVPGTYVLDEVQPTGWLDGKDSMGSLGGSLANDHMGSIVVNDSQNGTDYNFGEQIVADVYVTKSVTPTTSLPAATVTYTLTVGNKGPSTAQNVQLIDTLPVGETFVGAVAQGWTVAQSGNQLIFTQNSLASGASSTITITAVAPLSTGVYPNTAIVTTTTFETDLTNNQDHASVTVQTPPPSPETPPPLVKPCLFQIFSFSNFGTF